MTPNDYTRDVVPFIAELWPRCSQKTALNAERARWFLYYTVDEVLTALREHYGDSPNRWEPDWLAVRAALKERRRCRGLDNPNAWGVSDEITLSNMLTENAPRVQDGRLPAHFIDERWVCEHLIGKCPSQTERLEAWNLLDKATREANQRLAARGSGLRVTNLVTVSGPAERFGRRTA